MSAWRAWSWLGSRIFWFGAGNGNGDSVVHVGRGQREGVWRARDVLVGSERPVVDLVVVSDLSLPTVVTVWVGGRGGGRGGGEVGKIMWHKPERHCTCLDFRRVLWLDWASGSNLLSSRCRIQFELSGHQCGRLSEEHMPRAVPWVFSACLCTFNRDFKSTSASVVGRIWYSLCTFFVTGEDQ